MRKEISLLFGCITGGLAVALGAFGAHAFKSFLMTTGRLDTFELAVRYQFYHALALLATGLLMHHIQSAMLRYSSICFALGILFFSGSLYVLCLTGVSLWGAVTPVGGVLFIVGWILLGVGAYKK